MCISHKMDHIISMHKQNFYQKQDPIISLTGLLAREKVN